jgi:hypothetical protein
MADDDHLAASCETNQQETAELLARVEGALASSVERTKRELVARYGSLASLYLAEPSQALEACSSANLLTRTVAANAIAITGATSPSLPEIALRILRSEDPEELKEVACALLEGCSGVYPFPYLPSLLPLVLDDATSSRLRVCYYNAARRIEGYLVFAEEGTFDLSMDFLPGISSPEEIDWEWVAARYPDNSPS